VGVPKLVRGEASPDAGPGGSPAQIGSRRGVGPVPSARGSADDADQRSDRELEASVEPWLELLPAPRVHADFAAPSAFAMADEQRPTPLVEVSFAQQERCLDPEARPPEDHDKPSQALPMWAVAGCAHHGDDLLNLRRIGRV
jgi:hypothetical protein